jgi:hypothetical protein
MPQGSTLKILRSARSVIDKVQPPAWLSNLVQHPSASPHQQDRDKTLNRRRRFLASDCRNSAGASGLTRTAVLLGDYPVGYIDVAPTQVSQGKDDGHDDVAAAPRAQAVSFADKPVIVARRARAVSFVDRPVAVSPNIDWWDLRGAAGALSPHEPQMRATM